jgi:hypothetical protein
MKKAVILLFTLLSLSLFYTSIVNAEVTLNPNCHIDSASSVNFSNGTEIFLPFEYAKDTIENSDLVIFLGTNTDEFCNTINDHIEDYMADTTIVFTPEFFIALQSSSCSTVASNYFSNFKKSGKITSSSGTAFCSWDRMNISYSSNPEGIYFDVYNITNISVDDGETYSYSMRNLKKYGMSYLMKNPTVAFSGVVQLLAEAIHLNYLCGGYLNVNDYFNAVKSDYSSKYKEKILDANYTAGEVLEAGSSVPGSWAFGWLVNYALGSVNVPIIEALNLSDNVYLCSMEEIRGYSENTLFFNTTSETVIDSKTSTNVTLSVNVDTNLSAKIKIATYNENPGSNNYGLIPLGKYIAITANSSDFVNNLSNITIRVYYTNAEVTAADLNENNLRLEYYNASSNSWEVYDRPNGGVDTNLDYVWAITDHFSIWGIFEAIVAGPNINFTFPTESSGSMISTSSLKINVTVSDTGGGVKNTSIYLYNSSKNLINSSQNNYSCYQETATQSTPGDGNCGLDYSGSYAVIGTWSNALGVYDGSWVDPNRGNVASVGDIGYIYINYSKPANVINGTLWQVKVQNSSIPIVPVTTNITIPDDCFNQDILQLAIITKFNDYYPNDAKNSINETCWNGTAWKNLLRTRGLVIWEEAIIWNIKFSGFTSLSDGLYYFNATAFDLAGNRNSTETRNVTINTTVLTSETPSQGGGGGMNTNKSYAACTTSWSCAAWSICSGGKQTRTCSKLNESCYATGSKPLEQRLCYASNIAKGSKSKDTKQVLFDINLRAINKEVLDGEKLSVIVGLMNLGVSGRVNASLYYRILDSNNAEVYSEIEIVSVETQLEFIKEIDMSFLSPGNYKLTADLNYKGQKEPAHAEVTFTVSKPRGITGAVLGALTSNTGIAITLIVSLTISMIIVSNLLRKARFAKIKAFGLDKLKIVMLKSIYKS